MLEKMVCDSCGKDLVIGEWPFCPHGMPHAALDPNTHTSERIVVFESALEGRVQYPGRNDTQVPIRLLKRGYTRRELNVRELAAFEKKHRVMNERRHFDGHGKYD